MAEHRPHRTPYASEDEPETARRPTAGPESEPAPVAARKPAEATTQRPLPDLVAAVKALAQEMARHARLYEDAHTVQEALGGGSMAQVLEEVSGLDARRTALADEIGTLEARLVILRAEVAAAETPA
jgi:hypothetical protein